MALSRPIISNILGKRLKIIKSIKLKCKKGAQDRAPFPIGY